MNIKKCFENKALKVHYHKNYGYIFYKGFKLTKVKDKYSIEDTRYNDFYSWVKPKDMKVLEENGFIKGCDMLMYRRDRRRLKYYQNQIRNLKQKIVKRENLLLREEANDFQIKRIRNHGDRIKDYVKTLSLCETRVNNFKNKYK